MDKGSIYFNPLENKITIEVHIWRGDYKDVKILNEVDTHYFIMSQCDYIIGLLSTFLMWTSYTGTLKYF